uniref:NADH-ubiquinone oxidoreductase chain 6 n=1 Tax=Sceleocantha sp. 4 MJ-2019 TaxID=2607376 RepID=A0A6H0N6Q4_9CUCU|nr:NADH dehydrogenase subunit 6 [Sceleocantha sp. 4 MJ-2019]
MLLITVTLLIMSINFLFMQHPLSFGLILLIQTLLIALTTGMMNYDYWFSYILFLIMVGGMLILFIYMTSIASNEKFKFSTTLMILSLSLATIMILILMDQLIFNMQMFTYDLNSQNAYPNSYNSMTKFFNWPASSNLFLIIIYLLITLIMVVKITNIKNGPLRQMF